MGERKNLDPFYEDSLDFCEILGAEEEKGTKNPLNYSPKSTRSIHSIQTFLHSIIIRCHNNNNKRHSHHS